jgi:hypothetical protein
MNSLSTKKKRKLTMGRLPLPPTNAELAAIREIAQRNAPPTTGVRFLDALSNEQLRTLNEEVRRVGRQLTDDEREIVLFSKVQQKWKYGFPIK